MTATGPGQSPNTIAAAFSIERAPGTIRSWASRGLLDRHGEDEQGRTLYNLYQVEAVAQAGGKRPPSP